MTVTLVSWLSVTVTGSSGSSVLLAFGGRSVVRVAVLAPVTFFASVAGAMAWRLVAGSVALVAPAAVRVPAAPAPGSSRRCSRWRRRGRRARTPWPGRLGGLSAWGSCGLIAEQ
ncbi:hypothetical protein P9139_06195 [Curtobacterium flaccumfaciens]|nr:hypothetical protein P9139_06195 [Curtobacterium flaccumfaciens]